VDTRPVNVLSICSGYGGIELGLRSVIPSRTVCYVEREASAIAILASRIRDGQLDDAPIWTDLRTFDPGEWRGKVDILAGGFPCQPFSFAGKRLQSADERNLWPDVARIIDGIRPDRVFLENVTGILRHHHERIGPDLRGMGYSTQTGLFTASETGAPHRRERLFILAHADHSGHVHEQPGVEPGQRGVDAQRHPASGGGELAHAGLPLYPPGPNDHAGWAYLLSIMPEAQPTFCRDADGAPAGVGDQLRALGNGVIPAVAATAYRELSEMIGGERHGT